MIPYVLQLLFQLLAFEVFAILNVLLIGAMNWFFWKYLDVELGFWCIFYTNAWRLLTFGLVKPPFV